VTFSDVFRFDKKKEEAFQQFFYKQDLIICRVASLLVMAIMVILIILDYCRIQDFSPIIVAPRLIVFSVLAMQLFLTYQKNMTA